MNPKGKNRTKIMTEQLMSKMRFISKIRSKIKIYWGMDTIIGVNQQVTIQSLLNLSNNVSHK